MKRRFMKYAGLVLAGGVVFQFGGCSASILSLLAQNVLPLLLSSVLPSLLGEFATVPAT